jgi:hypothetical protein
MNPKTLLLIVQALDMLVSGIATGAALRERARAHIALIRGMVAENRGPTDAEFDALFAESEALTRELEAAIQMRRSA